MYNLLPFFSVIILSRITRIGLTCLKTCPSNCNFLAFTVCTVLSFVNSLVVVLDHLLLYLRREHHISNTFIGRFIYIFVVRSCLYCVWCSRPYICFKYPFVCVLYSFYSLIRSIYFVKCNLCHSISPNLRFTSCIISGCLPLVAEMIHCFYHAIYISNNCFYTEKQIFLDRETAISEGRPPGLSFLPLPQRTALTWSNDSNRLIRLLTSGQMKIINDNR